MTTPGRWLLMDATRQGELRFVLVEPDQPLEDAEIVRYEADGLPTFTDALIRYQRDMNVTLFGTTAALAVAGAVSGDTITIARSRWIISRSGLAPLFGRPVLIVNDVAARAWATLTGVQVRERLHGARDPLVTARGRTALLTLDDGIGAAAIDVDQSGRVTVVDSEAGHMDFAPADAAEERLCRSLAVTGEQPSWEAVLIAAMTGAAPGGGDAGLTARLAGRFAGNVVLALGAWQGVMLTGRHADKLATPAARAPFSTGLSLRRDFRRPLDAAPCWIVEQREAVLGGLASLLAAGPAG